MTELAVNKTLRTGRDDKYTKYIFTTARDGTYFFSRLDEKVNTVLAGSSGGCAGAVEQVVAVGRG